MTNDSSASINQEFDLKEVWRIAERFLPHHDISEVATDDDSHELRTEYIT